LRPDNGGNRDLCGHKITAEKIIRESSVRAPQAGHNLTGALQKASPKLNP